MDALKIKITSDGTGWGTTITDVESGKYLCCSAIKVEWKAGRMVATLEIENVEIEYEGEVVLTKETVRRYQSVPADFPSIRKSMEEARRQPPRFDLQIPNVTLLVSKEDAARITFEGIPAASEGEESPA